MEKYDPSVHTPEALAAQINSIYSRKPDFILAGSIGRSVIHSFLSGNYLAEFENDNPAVRTDGKTRDIDTIDLGPELAVTNPFEVDTVSFGSPIVSIQRQGSDWFLASERKGFESPIHPAVMEPVEAEILGGVRALTIPAQTHLHLLGLRGIMRDKEHRNLGILNHAIETTQADTLPDELFIPFRTLRETWQLDYILRFRQRYRDTVPAPIRKHLRPVNTRVMKLLGRD